MRAAVFLITLTMMFTAVSCSQEMLIYIKNMNRTPFITLDQVLHESGLSKRPDTNRPSVKPLVATNPPPADRTVKVPEAARALSVNPGTDYTIQLKKLPGNWVLKSIQGDSRYLKERSSPGDGLFVFQSGTGDTKISFGLYDEMGAPVSNVSYYITAGRKDDGKPLSVSNTVKISPDVKPRMTATNSGSPADTNSGMETGGATNAGGIYDLIQSAVRGLSPRAAINELERLLESTETSIADKDRIRARLLDLFLAESLFSQAERLLPQLTDEYERYLYQARLANARRKSTDATRFYIMALSGKGMVKKSAVNELSAHLAKVGKADRELLARLEQEADKYKDDREANGESLIRIAQLYPMVMDVYKAENIYRGILNGDYSQSVKNRARTAYDQLKRDFLEYR